MALFRGYRTGIGSVIALLASVVFWVFVRGELAQARLGLPPCTVCRRSLRIRDQLEQARTQQRLQVAGIDLQHAERDELVDLVTERATQAQRS